MNKEELFAFLQPEEKHLRAYVPSPFIVAALPARDVKNLPFQRNYNGITLTLSGLKHVPYGRYGRLLLTILTTHAVLSKNSGEDTVTIEYKNLSNLLKELQLPRTRGKEIREQLEYFSHSAFIFEEKKSVKTKKGYLRELFDEEEYNELTDNVTVKKYSTGMIPFISELQLLDVSSEGTKKTAAITIKLSSEFSKYSREHSVPIDYTIYKDITSPIGKDLYSWLMYRCNSLCDNQEIFIPEKSLIDQFMPVEEGSARNQEWRNYDYIKGLIQEIKTKYCPELNVEFITGGMQLKHSKIPNLKSEYYVLVTSNL